MQPKSGSEATVLTDGSCSLIPHHAEKNLTTLYSDLGEGSLSTQALQKKWGRAPSFYILLQKPQLLPNFTRFLNQPLFHAWSETS